VQQDVAQQLHQLHAQVCKAIADPKRLMIITELRDGELSVGEICDALDISQSNASQHLAVLRERGIVVGRRVGTTVYYRLTSDKIVAALDLLREFIRDRSRLGESGLSTVFLG
jgi:DNA-binding transcriptional ArsR family regulator